MQGAKALLAVELRLHMARMHPYVLYAVSAIFVEQSAKNAYGY
jgi:hypothetical protein